MFIYVYPQIKNQKQNNDPVICSFVRSCLVRSDSRVVLGLGKRLAAIFTTHLRFRNYARILVDCDNHNSGINRLANTQSLRVLNIVNTDSKQALSCLTWQSRHRELVNKNKTHGEVNPRGNHRSKFHHSRFVSSILFYCSWFSVIKVKSISLSHTTRLSVRAKKQFQNRDLPLRQPVKC